MTRREPGRFVAYLRVSTDSQARSGLGLEAQRQTVAAHVAQPHELAGADTVLLIDVLYQLTTELQLTLLRSAAALTRQRLILRTADPAAGWRSMVSAGMERLGRGAGHAAGQRAPGRQQALTLTKHVEAPSKPCASRAIDRSWPGALYLPTLCRVHWMDPAWPPSRPSINVSAMASKALCLRTDDL